jgi:hypothetical protein
MWIAFAFTLGYLATLTLAMMATFSIATAWPGFVVRGSRLRGRYKWLHQFVWLLCLVAGGYVVSALTGAKLPWLEETAFASLLVVVLWQDSREAEPRGAFHMAVATLLTVAGVILGFEIRMQGL